MFFSYNTDCCFNDNTTYQLSYFNCGGEKSDAIKPPENICVSSCPLSHDTIHKVSNNYTLVISPM